MAGMETWRRRISLLLVIALLFTPMMQVSAEEIPEETTQMETVAEMEIPPETEVPPETEDLPDTEIPPETEAPQETEASPEPEMSQNPDVSEEPLQMESEVYDSGPSVVTIADVLHMENWENLPEIRGTVVFASANQTVLQDDSGGIRLVLTDTSEIAVGDLLQVTVRRSGSGFGAEEFEKIGTSELPIQEAALTEGREAVRILVKGVLLDYMALIQNENSFQLIGNVPAGIKSGNRVDVCGVMLDGMFYADTITLAENQEPEYQEPEETDSRTDCQWDFYFGQLHAHTDISDGQGTVEEAFAYAKQTENLDFFAVTDHSNAFDNGEQGSLTTDGSLISQEWAAGKAAAASVTDGSFVGIFGYEMTWPEDKAIGHINTFGTPGWQTRDQEGMKKLSGYLDALAAVPDSVSQFNHPGTVYGDFKKFSGYTPQYDARVHLLEVGGEGGFTAYGAFTKALDAGWHLAPSNNQNNHNGNWGNENQARTVVLAQTLTEEAIYDAIRNYRVYATEDGDLRILYHLNNRIMGSEIAQTETLTATILVEDGSGDSIGRIEVITNGGQVAASTTLSDSHGECSLNLAGDGSYYYLRVLRNEKIVAVTAPVWVETYEDLGIADLTADKDKVVQGESVALALTLFNNESLPFVVESVTFSVGAEEIGRVDRPGTVASLGTLTVPLTYTREFPGSVTVVATVKGSIGGLSRSHQKTIALRFRAPEASKQSIDKVRKGVLGESYRIRGYVTAGTSNPFNTFPDSIYLQDDTGGMEIMDFSWEGIQLGTPVEVEGILRSSGGNLVLAMTDYQVLEENGYRYVPETMEHAEAMDYETHGGELLQIEGHVVSLTLTPDKKGVSRFTLRDTVGEMATVVVEDGIGSGAYGTNALSTDVKMTRAVRAMGLLHIDDYGQTVLRVRNCDEVAYVPPRRDPSNPRTGDWLGRLLYRK